MLSFHGGLKVYVATAPCDLRKSFNGLWALVSEELNLDPKSGAVFLFTNRCKNRIKILYWDGTGVWIMTKRLEAGTYWWPKSAQPGAKKISLTPEAFAMLINGVELRDGGLRAWYERES